MTVLEGIQRSAEFLAKKGVDSPRLQAELLLAHVLKLPRMELYLNFERTLSAQEVDALRELVKRRGQREPLQHIVGSTLFCGYEIAVNQHVLVPRPETELLAEVAWDCLLRLAREPERRAPARRIAEAESPRAERLFGAPTVLDFGTGSACLAIVIAAQCPAARVTALEVSPEALAVARQNLARHGLERRIELIQGDGFSPLPAEARFNLIISNPPYIPSAEIATLAPEVRDFEPRVALDGGADGLDCIRRLAAEAGAFLTPGGRLMVEFGDGQADGAREIFARQNWIVEAVREDYSQRPRFIIASLKR